MTTVEEIDFAVGAIFTALVDIRDDADAERVRIAIQGVIDAGGKAIGLLLLLSLAERVGCIAIGGPQ